MTDRERIEQIEKKFNIYIETVVYDESDNIISLDLSSHKVSKYDFLKDLSNLTSLDLSNNNLSNVDFLKDLTKLRLLYLSFNKLSNIDGLKDLTNLTSLDLSSNNLSNVDFLKDLTNLSSLALSSNNLSNIDGLKDLTNLTSLALRNNKVSNIDFLKDLTNLRSLDLSFNNLSNVDFLKDLTNLSSLDLSYNNLSNVDFLKDLTNLRSLDLSFNNLSNIDVLKDLTNLRSLDLRNNSLSNVNVLKNLTNLRSLDLSSNKVSDVDVLKNLTKLFSLDLRGNPNLQIPEEILSNSTDAQKILSYIRELSKGQTEGTNIPLNEGKIVLIGQGNVGKTSLRKCLIEGICNEDEPKTEGLEVVTWDLNKLENLSFDHNELHNVKYEDVKLNVWDFGGQEIYHTTHRFFFNSRCLYLLVADFNERKNWDTNQIEYWLKTIEFLIKDEKENDQRNQNEIRSKTPVLIIGNKADKTTKEVIPYDSAKLAEKYPSLEIIDFIPISCQKYKNIEKVIKTILHQLERIGVFLEIPAKYAESRSKIKEDDRAFILQKDFTEFCSNEDVYQIRSILNDIGTIKAFGEDKKIKSDNLKNLIVLKPHWITKGIYKILSANHLLDTNKGEATKEEIRSLLDKNVYPNIDVIVEMMEEFYICRQVSFEDESGEKVEKYIFPSFFSIQRPEGYVSMMRKPSPTKIEFIFEYSMLSENVISFFIIEVSKLPNFVAEFWREGAYIKRKFSNDHALVESDPEENLIRITVKSDSLELSQSLFNDIKSIFDMVHRKKFIPNPSNDKFLTQTKVEINTKERLAIIELEKAQQELNTLRSEKTAWQGNHSLFSERIETIRPLKAGYETLTEVAELEKTNSKVEGFITERVRTYDGYSRAFVVAIGFFIVFFYYKYYETLKIWHPIVDIVLTFGLLSLITALFNFVWSYFYSESFWITFISWIKKIVRNNQKAKNQEKLDQYIAKQNELEQLQNEINKAKEALTESK